MSFETAMIKALEISMYSECSINTSKIINGGIPIYIIGKNDQSIEFIKKYKVSGLIDDYSARNESWYGLPIFKSKEIDPAAIVVNCVTSISPVLVRQNLLAAGLHNIVPISELISRKTNLLSQPVFVSQQRSEFSDNVSWYANLYDRLSDEISRTTLIDVLRFRLTANYEYMNDYPVRMHDQYFESFMEYRSEAFVDAGGFDGDTTEEFINRHPDYSKIYFFEPSIKNFNAAKKRLQGRRDIEFNALGLSDKNGTLYFNPNAGSASAVSHDYGEVISVVTLDSFLDKEPVSFIKMDLEGWEMNALLGSETIIRTRKPKLAIGVYHSAKDFREIPRFLLSLNPKYGIYLRHYTQGWSETVMYFK